MAAALLAAAVGERAAEVQPVVKDESPSFSEVDRNDGSINNTAMKPDVAFASIIFLQGEPALPALRLLERRRVTAALHRLREHEIGDELLGRDDLDPKQPWGSGDSQYRLGGYVIAANHKLQYVSLAKRC